MNLQVIKKDGKPSTQKVKLNPNVFEAETKDHVVYLSVN